VKDKLLILKKESALHRIPKSMFGCQKSITKWECH